MSSVMVADAWPTIACSSLMSAPSAIRAETAKWRRSWNRKFKPARASAGLNSRRTKLPGSSGVPTNVAKTKSCGRVERERSLVSASAFLADSNRGTYRSAASVFVSEIELAGIPAYRDVGLRICAKCVRRQQEANRYVARVAAEDDERRRSSRPPISLRLVRSR